jgi:hypothetical protein
MRNFVLVGIAAVAGGLCLPGAADAQQVIGTRGADPSNPYTHGYYSPLPGVMYSPFRDAPVVRQGRGFYGPAFGGPNVVIPVYSSPYYGFYGTSLAGPNYYFGYGTTVLQPSRLGSPTRWNRRW